MPALLGADGRGSEDMQGRQPRAERSAPSLFCLSVRLSNGPGEVRRIFPRCWFNEATTEAGRDALGYYHERRDENRNVGLGPEHDWSSHAADAFGYLAISYEEPPVKSTGMGRPLPPRAGSHWAA